MSKRIFDVFFSSISLLMLFPLCLFIALLIKLDSKGSIFFKQKRVGKLQNPFFLYKFRSMVPHHYSAQELGPIKHNHFLVTRVGHFLRRTKLDEIPQFINVLRGDMSLIGPRPCLYESVSEMSDWEKKRFDFLPGITGWAEVNGNVELTQKEQYMLDVWYIHHHSFLLDVRIFWRTILTILKGPVRNPTALKNAQDFCQTHT